MCASVRVHMYYVLETFDDVGQIEPVPAVADHVRPQLLKGNVEILIDIGRPQLIVDCPVYTETERERGRDRGRDRQRHMLNSTAHSLNTLQRPHRMHNCALQVRQTIFHQFAAHTHTSWKMLDAYGLAHQ